MALACVKQKTAVDAQSLPYSSVENSSCWNDTLQTAAITGAAATEHC